MSGKGLSIRSIVDESLTAITSNENVIYFDADASTVNRIVKGAIKSVFRFLIDKGLYTSKLVNNFQEIFQDVALDLCLLAKENHPLAREERILFLYAYNRIKQEVLGQERFFSFMRIPINGRTKAGLTLLREKAGFFSLKSSYWEIVKLPIQIKDKTSVKQDIADARQLFSKIIKRHNFRRRRNYIAFVSLSEDQSLNPSAELTCIFFGSLDGRNYISTKKWGEAWGESCKKKLIKGDAAQIKSEIRSELFDIKENIGDVSFLNDIQCHSVKSFTMSHSMRSILHGSLTKRERALWDIYSGLLPEVVYNKNSLKRLKEQIEKNQICLSLDAIPDSGDYISFCGKNEILQVIPKQEFKKIKLKSK